MTGVQTCALPISFNAWVVLKGLETLGIRMAAQSANALKLAQWLEQQPAVDKVYYPGLASHPQHALAMAQQSNCGGAVVSFTTKPAAGPITVSGKALNDDALRHQINENVGPVQLVRVDAISLRDLSKELMRASRTGGVQ